jgi:hypothetical protein
MPNSEIKKLRKEQQKKVMREIGGMMDAWDQLPNDVKDMIREDAPGLLAAIYRICDAMEC